MALLIAAPPEPYVHVDHSPQHPPAGVTCTSPFLGPSYPSSIPQNKLRPPIASAAGIANSAVAGFSIIVPYVPSPDMPAPAIEPAVLCAFGLGPVDVEDPTESPAVC